jgi:predicted thioesterase
MRPPVEAADTHPWQFYVTPYLWVAGVSGTMTTANPRLPDQEISAGFGAMLSHLDAIPVMGSFEARYGRIARNRARSMTFHGQTKSILTLLLTGIL